MRILYLDDSGKLHPNDTSKFVVFGGISVDEGNWHKLVRQINGAKAAFFAKRGNPNDWETKSTDCLTNNAWNRSNIRRFCFEIVRILQRNGCHVYVVSIEKAKIAGLAHEEKFIPLAFQRLIAKFFDEIVNSAATGTIVCDWSAYRLDQHIAKCVTSMVVSKNMQFLRGGVTYADSHALPPLQACDLIAGAFRRHFEGHQSLQPLVSELSKLRYQNPGALDVHGYPVDSIFSLF